MIEKVIPVVFSLIATAIVMVADRVHSSPHAATSVRSFVSVDHWPNRYLHLTKTIRPSFNAAARPVTRPPAARSISPRPKPPVVRSAPAPRSFAPRNARPRAAALRPAPVRPNSVRASTPRSPLSVARAGNRPQTITGPRIAYRAQANRGVLRPTFNRAAKPPVRTGARSNATTLRGAQQNLRRDALRPTFNRSKLKSKAASEFRRANSYQGARAPVTWRLTKPGEVFYRSHYGTRSKQSGPYASPIRPVNLRNARNSNALPPWNKAYRLSRFVGTGREFVGISRVAPAFGRPGGGVQAYFPRAPIFGSAGWNRGALTEIFSGPRFR